MKLFQKPDFTLTLIIFTGVMALHYGFTPYTAMQRLSFSLESRTLSGGKIFKSNASACYSVKDTVFTVHYEQPDDYYIITGPQGMAVYSPRDSSLVKKSGIEYGTQSSFLYYFLNSGTNDLGLKQMGFTLSETGLQDTLMVTRWLPPANLAKWLGKIELVHRDMIPVYIAYYNRKNEIMTKIYYYNFFRNETITVPLKITEISYQSKNDSVISRTEIKNLKVNDETGDLCNFSLPPGRYTQRHE